MTGTDKETGEPVEIEKKYCLPDRVVFDRVKEYLKTAEWECKMRPIQKHTDTYYDTADRELDKRDCILRIREKSGSYKLTIKKPITGDLTERYEYEKTIDGPVLDGHGAFIEERLGIDTRALVVSLVIENNRETILLCDGEARLEMALDDICCRRDGIAARDYQLEIELKSGSLRAQLERLAEELERNISGLSVCSISKYRRGLNLTRSNKKNGGDPKWKED
ncbi:MAG: CYTH domain-containing protein [Eubacteriales bacterium]|jgi:inorganic triphosphatase YgiF|nr:CYTH domain-containing protein [Eubacteriales bacterium]